MGFIKWLARRGLLGHHSAKIKEVQDLEHPKCASFSYGKQVRSPSQATHTTPRPERTGVLKQEKLEPDNGVAVAHSWLDKEEDSSLHQDEKGKKIGSKEVPSLLTWPAARCLLNFKSVLRLQRLY